MSFRPRMTSFLVDIRLAAPLTYRCWNGVVADLWQVEVGQGGRGEYTACDPRIVVVLGAGDSPLKLHLTSDMQAFPVSLAYIPAHMPVRASFCRCGALSHLDLHFDQTFLARRLSSFGLDAKALLSRPLLISKDTAAVAIAGLIADEIRSETADDLVLDTLTGALAAKVFTGAGALQNLQAQRGGLTISQLDQVERYMRAQMHRRLPVLEMAQQIGLSESWFAHAYRQSRGQTPHRALQAMRVEQAKMLLADGAATIADIAIILGFSDQAHLTRAFRAATGQTPGAWRKKQLLQQDPTIPDSFGQDSPAQSH